MAQKIFTNYKDQVESFPLGEQNIGMLKPGRYSGFDKVSYAGVLAMILGHEAVVRKTGQDNLYKDVFGAVLLPTGSILHDDTDISLTIDNNLGNTNPRYDYVICEHNYQAIVGGTQAQYSILKGPLDGTEPTLVNPQTQVILGKITIEAGGHENSHVTYVPEMVQLPGDLTYTQLAAWVNEVVIFPTQFLVPTNGIIMFNGTAGQVPEGWALCDGANGTPDLRDRFIVSVGTTHTLGNTGGSHSVTIAKANLPAENYSANTSSTGGHTHSGTAESGGGHSHTANTTTAGAHNHGWTGNNGAGWPDGSGDSTTPGSSNSYPRQSKVENAGGHSHTVTINNAGEHSHTIAISSAGDHNHSVTIGPLGSGTAMENRPAYYALAFIMKL